MAIGEGGRCLASWDPKRHWDNDRRIDWPARAVEAWRDMEVSNRCQISLTEAVVGRVLSGHSAILDVGGRTGLTD